MDIDRLSSISVWAATETSRARGTIKAQHLAAPTSAHIVMSVKHVSSHESRPSRSRSCPCGRVPLCSSFSAHMAHRLISITSTQPKPSFTARSRFGNGPAFDIVSSSLNVPCYLRTPDEAYVAAPAVMWSRRSHTFLASGISWKIATMPTTHLPESHRNHGPQCHSLMTARSFGAPTPFDDLPRNWIRRRRIKAEERRCDTPVRLQPTRSFSPFASTPIRLSFIPLFRHVRYFAPLPGHPRHRGLRHPHL